MSRDHERRFRQGVLACTFLSFGLAGCSEAPPPPRAEVIRPAIIKTVGLVSAGEPVRFPGRVRAAKRAELSFNVPGLVTEFTIAEGRQVKAGEVVARIDANVLRARVTSALAEFERANADLARYERLWRDEQAVARSEVDDRRSRLEVARTNLAAAEQDLADSVLRAPFDGVITRRRVEAYASVQAKQPIADLQDLSAMEVVINVPERMAINKTTARGATAVFEGRQPVSAPLTLKSYSLESDPMTQTYEVVLSLDERPPGINVLPGMGVTVVPAAPPRDSAGNPLAVPLTAVVGAANGEAIVWAVGDDGGIVRRSVRLGEIRGAEILVLSGLAVGERIVAAGVSELREGMKVRPLDDEIPAD